ncbi:MAG: N-acetylmuramoyl-L-alanine amidase, partial [Bacteroidales bacterium]|nr:N-acetylmuramoyl-L-alanine amidase [Bacteroidales bacterium]
MNLISSKYKKERQKRNNLLLLMFFLIMPMLIFSQNSNSFTVVIDPGHGGKDPGAVGKKGYEKTVVLSISKKLGKLINESMPEVKVIYTREKDEFIELFKRAQIANDAKADLFISIHANANKNTNAVGTDTWVMGLHKSQQNLDVAMKENAAIFQEENYLEEYDGFDPKSPSSYIVFNILQSEFLVQSTKFAMSIQENLKKMERVDRGVNQAGFLVLWRTSMPSVLIETGFISNPEEEEYLLSEAGQDTIAHAIFYAFSKYKKHFDSKKPIEKDKVETIEIVKDTIKNDLFFTVQIASSPKKINTKPTNFKGIENVWEIETDGYFKYYSEKSKNYQEAVNQQKVIKEKYSDCFIVAFKNGKKITV